jgi:hypothetical protein
MPRRKSLMSQSNLGHDEAIAIRRRCGAAREHGAFLVGRLATLTIPQRCIKQGSQQPQDAAPVSRHRSAPSAAGVNSVAAHKPLEVIDFRRLLV